MNQIMINLRQKEDIQLVENQLKKYLADDGHLQSDLLDSMRYSLLSGGKRIRPILVLEFCRLCGGDTKTALPFACAIEMVHTYSLIHDDLPCMDNDDMRRGRASNHKVFGEDMALLAGDALLTLAFETMLSDDAIAAAGAQRAAAAAGTLARAAGAHCMVGGQVIDLLSEGRIIPIETLKEMDDCKTGALIVAAATIGCIIGDADDEKLHAAQKYARAIGLAFQIQDDILDIEGDTQTLGKKVGSDAANDKCTYVSLLGMDKAKKLVEELTQSALDALPVFGAGSEFLSHLAKSLASREN
jgi:geranylgeranyl diphosphate synthase type II